jgi:predicted nucleic acid-binding protein
MPSLVQIYFRWRPALRDPNDDRFLETAVRSDASAVASDELYQRAAEISATEKMSIEELFASAFEERLLEFERLKEKAASGS